MERKNLVRNSEYLPLEPNNLWDIEGARRKRLIVGRGPASNSGKTCGRGHNGQKSRNGTGKIKPSFVGGQNPLNKRLPKKGFNNSTKKPLEVINIRNLVYFIKKNRLDATKIITMKDLLYSRALSNIDHGVKLLAKGAEELEGLGVSIHLEVTDASSTAVEAITKAGGSVTAVYHTSTTLRRFLHPEQFKIPEAKIPMPHPKKVMKLEKLREKGLELKYPKAPWYEDYKVEKEQELKDAEAREKTPGEKVLPQYPADRSPGVSLNKPRVERQLLAKKIVYPIP
jgi:large subunit ribosomal protein L15